MAYTKAPAPGLVRPAFKPSPLRAISVVSAGKLSKPAPIPMNPKANGPKNPAPSPVPAPGYSGSI